MSKHVGKYAWKYFVKMPKRPGKHCNAGSSGSWCWRGRGSTFSSAAASESLGPGMKGARDFRVFSYQIEEQIFRTPEFSKSQSSCIYIVFFLWFWMNRKYPASVGKRNHWNHIWHLSKLNVWWISKFIPQILGKHLSYWFTVRLHDLLFKHPQKVRTTFLKK